MRNRKNQIFTSLSTVCFILLTVNLFILRSIQPVGYVVDIYSMFPFYFYLILIICYLIATFLVLNGVKVLGVLILCLNHFEVLIIPYMLGYYSMGRADDMAYIGEYRQIATIGHFSLWDIYPASHIIGASISIISNLEAHYVSFIIPIVFSFIFIAGIYLFSRKLFPDTYISYLALVSSFILYLGIYHFTNVPNALFFAFMPFYLWSLHKYLDIYDTPFSIIFILMALLIPITHPFIVFFVFLVFLLHIIPRFLNWPRMKILQIQIMKRSSFLVLAVSVMNWLINNQKIMEYYSRFINEISEPVIFKTTDKLAKTNFDFFEYMKLSVFFYGRYIIPTFIIFISWIYLYYHKDLLKEKAFRNYPYLLIFYAILVVTQIILLFNPIISHQPYRIMNLNFAAYSQIPLFACSLSLFLGKSKSFSKLLLVCGILSIIWSFSFFGCLDSPNVFRENVALTSNEICGMDWLYNMKDGATIVAPVSQIDRFHSILFGASEDIYIKASMPDHFGYVNGSDNFVDINHLDQNSYVAILTPDELLYQTVPGYNKIGRYIVEDFRKFRADTSVSKIYDSINIEIFRTNLQ